MRFLCLVELILAVVTVQVPAPAKPYRLPDRVASPQPMPVEAGYRLSPATLFVIDSDTPLVVLCSPAKLVVVSHEPGPIRVRGVFVDTKNGGKPETRTYSGKHVYTLDASHAGAGEILIVPVGAERESDRIPITVDDGSGPRPPPDPIDPPPGPSPVTPAKLFVIAIEETAEAVAGRGAMFADKTLAARFSEKGHRWRVVDKDVQGADGKPPEDVRQFLDEAKGKALPRLYLVSIEGGKRVVRYAGNAPTTAAGLLELLNKHGG